MIGYRSREENWVQIILYWYCMVFLMLIVHMPCILCCCTLWNSQKANSSRSTNRDDPENEEPAANRGSSCLNRVIVLILLTIGIAANIYIINKITFYWFLVRLLIGYVMTGLILVLHLPLIFFISMIVCIYRSNPRHPQAPLTLNNPQTQEAEGARGSSTTAQVWASELKISATIY